jgi:zinc protease
VKRALFIILVAACGGNPQPTTIVAGPPPTPQETKVTPPPAPTTQTAQPQDLKFPNEDFRAKQPEAGQIHAFSLPVMKPFALPNGIKVYLVEQHTLPLVSMDLNFDGGSLTDPKGKEGLASICTSMLTEGTEKLDKIQFSEALADVASSVNAYAADDSQGLGLASLTKHLPATFALFADTLRTPGLRQSDLDRMVKRRIEAVKQARGNPTAIPGRVSDAILYGPTHPFGAITTEQSLAAITLADCKKQLAEWMQPKNARLFVVGDLTEQQVRDTFAQSSLADWKGAAPKLPALPEPKTMAGRIFFVHVPNAAQSTVLLMEHGPIRTAPDYFSNTIMASVFGGSFTSRLNMNLREDKGYAYGARGGLSYSKHYGALTASASVQTDATYQSLLEISREMTELWAGKHPVSKDELEREKLNATLALPGKFATAQAALGQYRSLVYYGLPLDYFNTYAEHVGKITEAEVKKSAAAHLKPAPAVFLVVGDGDAKMIVDDPAQPKDKRRVPFLKDGTQVTLRQALKDLAAKGDVGSGGFVELDVDGHIVR